MNKKHPTYLGKRGEWIVVVPTDCFTAVPVHQCSVCKHLEDGYDPGLICPKCGSQNKINNKKFVSLPIFKRC